MNNIQKYIDKVGRFHHIENPETGSYLDSFYAKMVGLHVVISHPAASELMNLDTKVLNLSSEEYAGIAGLDPVYANLIVAYGEANYWQFCGEHGFTPTPWRKLVIDDVLASYEGLANDPEDYNKAIIKYPDLYPISYWHNPAKQYFYYRCAGRTPGIIRTIFFIFSTLFSIFEKNNASPQLGFQLLKIKKLRPNFFEKGLIRLFNRNFNDWIDACEFYFPDDHPVLDGVFDRHSYIGGGI